MMAFIVMSKLPLPEQTKDKLLLQLTKKELTEIESRLTEAISVIAPAKSLRLTLTELVNQLCQSSKQQNSQLKSLQHQGTLLRTQQESLQKQVISLTKTIAERDIEMSAQKQYAQEEARSSSHRYQQLQTELERLQQQNRVLLDELHQLKLQRVGESGQGEVMEQLRTALRQRQELANRLQLKAHEVVRSEKDKQALEQYYDQKWNSEYKKVKVKLQQTYNLRIAQLEEQTQLRTLSIQNQLHQLQQEKLFYQRRNQQLEDRFNADQKDKEALTQTIQHLNKQIQELTTIIAQSAIKLQAEKNTMKIQFSQEKVKMEKKMKQLQEDIQAEVQKLIDYSRQQEDLQEQMRKKHHFLMIQNTRKHQNDRNQLKQKYDSELKKLEKQSQQQLYQLQMAKSQVESDFQSTLLTLKTDYSRMLAQKQDEYNRSNLRWIDKHCQLENLMGIQRRKHEDETSRLNQQIEALIDKEYALYREIDGFKESLRQLQDKSNELRTIISQKQETIKERDDSISALELVLASTKQQVDILQAKRKHWTDQLISFGKEFQHSFDELRKTHQKQINLYRGRINELEELNSNRIKNQKQLDRIQKAKEEKFKPEIHIREAQNLILHRVKDYYETRFREDPDMAKTTYKNSHAILARKLKKNRAHVQEAISHRVFDTRPSIGQQGRYSSSAQKDYQSLSREKFDQSYKLRVQTMTSFK